MVEQVHRLSLFLTLGFVAVAVALGYWQVVGAEDVLSRPSNPRIVEEERRILRGEILDRNGEVLASSRRVGELAERTYTYPPLAHVTGYASTRYGKSGVEEAFDSYLGGRLSAGALTALRDKLFHRARSGSDLTLTIDLGLQRAADEALGDNRGAIVALHAETGEVLALASHPYFDPSGVDQNWEALAADPSEPFVHRALQGQYVPGSTFKLITDGAALDLGIVDPRQRHHHEGDLFVQGLRVRNTNHPQLRDLTFAEEFAWSCNVAHALVGLSLGVTGRVDFNFIGPAGVHTWRLTDPEVQPSVQRFREYAERFGIGVQTPFDLPTARGRISGEERMGAGELAAAGFGQGNLQVTPLQMALAAATIARGGEMPAPYLVATAQDPDGSEITIHRPGAILRRVISGRAAAELNAMMVLSVETAYARPARIPGIAVGGKTGTAEVGPGQQPHAWFVGYAPADRPGVVVAVIMENRGSGTTFATPAGQRVLETAIRSGY